MLGSIAGRESSTALDNPYRSLEGEFAQRPCLTRKGCDRLFTPRSREGVERRKCRGLATDSKVPKIGFMSSEEKRDRTG